MEGAGSYFNFFNDFFKYHSVLCIFSTVSSYWISLSYNTTIEYTLFKYAFWQIISWCYWQAVYVAYEYHSGNNYVNLKL